MNEAEVSSLFQIWLIQSAIFLSVTVSNYYLSMLLVEVITLILGVPALVSDRWLLFIAVIYGLLAVIK